MKKKEFSVALNDAKVTTGILVDGVNNIIDILEKCSPNTAGEILGDAVAIVGIAHQLLIDANNLAKSVE